jgi:hypothetical protein
MQAEIRIVAKETAEAPLIRVMLVSFRSVGLGQGLGEEGKRPVIDFQKVSPGVESTWL